MTERWKPVVGWDGLYEVSNLGRVKCLKRHRVCERILKPSLAGKGYRKVQLVHKDRREHHYVHELVLSAFVGPRPDGQESAHWNGARDDNKLSNLRWDTKPGNHADKHRHGTMCHGETHGRRKLSEREAIEIKSSVGSCKEIGDRFGVGPMQVHRIKSGKNWSHIQ